MNQLHKYLTQEEINKLGDNPQVLAKLHEHFSSQLYKDANFNFNRTQTKQIIKGAETYEKPLGEAEWTPKQLLQHAMEEVVDTTHYLTMLHSKVEELEKDLQKANTDALYWRKKYIDVKLELDALLDASNGPRIYKNEVKNALGE